MAPFTCKVVDATNRSISGIHVLLQCRGQPTDRPATFQGITDSSGGISLWLPTRTALIDSANAQLVDVTLTPRLSLTFLPRTTLFVPSGPWVSFNVDLHLPGADWHGVICRLDTSPIFEYCRYPVADPVVTRPKLHTDWATGFGGPPPLRLPSPVAQTRKKRAASMDVDIASPLASKARIQ